MAQSSARVERSNHSPVARLPWDLPVLDNSDDLPIDPLRTEHTGRDKSSLVSSATQPSDSIPR